MAEANLPEKIASQLRRNILRGILLPGDSIKERDNASELGVSRTPMREAIRILAKEGLVLLRPSRSPIVAELDYDEVADQAEVLIALEKLSARLACVNATDDELQHIAGIVAHMAAHFDDTDPLDMFEIDMSFHTAIAQASHNKSLAETHRTYLQRLWHARYLAASQRRNRDRVVSEHGRIVDSLHARDVEAARAAIDNHLWHLAEDIRSLIDSQTENAEDGALQTGDVE